MVATSTTIGFLPRADLQRLIDLLRQDGRTLLGPTVADGAIVYDEIEGVADLPAGWGSEQSPGRFRLQERGGERLFDYAVPPTTWKRFVFPPEMPLSVATRNEDGTLTLGPAKREIPKLAFLGVRACELAALGIEDRVFLAGPYTDEDFRARRNASIVVAVQCAEPASTCFCTSMGTGPGIRSGHDISLIELDEGFLVTAGSTAGSAIMEQLPLGTPTADHLSAASDQLVAAREKIGDPVEARGLHDRLLAKLDSPRWAEVAERCTACGNCTLSCPTCFCTTTVYQSDLDGVATSTERLWESCFNEGFGKVAGGNFRYRFQDRYRQWLTHKFATWIDQFGTSGCVGCGRCITWCPVGIDVREELNAIAPPSGVMLALPEIKPVPPPRPGIFTIASKREETPDTTTLVLTKPGGMDWKDVRGEFVMVSLPGIGSVPISVSQRTPEGMVLTIRSAGPATTAITNLDAGAQLAVSGPMGVDWEGPLELAHGKDIVVVAGGLGLPPVRPVIDTVMNDRDKFGAFRLYYGARTPSDLLYKEELAAWSARGDMEVAVTVDRADATWLGRVGIVTYLFDQASWDGSKVIAFLCGPERMIQASCNVLQAHGVTPDRIFISMERHMQCGIGLCGHCQMGKFFVCKDGPVFSLAQLGDTFGREGI